MSDETSNIHISFYERRKNALGPLIVECRVSGRFLKFHEKSSILTDGEYITVDVMAMQIEDNKKPRKICQLIVTREDLLEALKHVSPEENR